VESKPLQNLETLVTDNIRTLKIPQVKSSHPLVIIMTGIPASGKTYLAQRLSEQLPFCVVSETAMRHFLARSASFFDRKTEKIHELGIPTIERLLQMGVNTIYDSNIATRALRETVKTRVAAVGGVFVLIYLNCSKEVAYQKIKKHNIEIMRGDKEGFIMDIDYFNYEIAKTQAPLIRESPLTYDSSQNSNQLQNLIRKIKEKMDFQEMSR